MYLSNIKIVHFFEASVLAEALINSLKPISENSIFYIINNGHSTAKYINNDDVFLYDISNEKECKNTIEKINKTGTHIAVFHQMNSQKQKIINALEDEVKKVWCIWGNDLYENNSFIQFKLYDKYTSDFLESSNILKKIYEKFGLKKTIFSLLYYAKKNQIFEQQLQPLFSRYGVNRFETLRKIDAIGYIVPKEIEFLKPVFPNKTYVHLYSNPNLPQFKHFTDNKLSAANILVGNSAAPTNNHLDCFHILKSTNIGNRKIIVPLSYGGNQNYIKHIIEKGNEFFGENFLPLVDRMPLDKYSELLSSCSVAIMNQKRQQSGGNLFHLVGSGVKIFMNSENGFYDYFKKNNIKVFDINDFAKNFEKEIDLSENRKFLNELYSEDHFKSEVNKLLQLIR